ncbi:hypothetical protein [Evansella clarkii]|jgi:uncharacterized membrane protein|uniref:hypothetical protein n=1 Tax=Evansella clarkii TaxID=79879 RepID=UPI000995F4A6|nr:hypothetical protein [Evansella clarkii]
MKKTLFRLLAVSFAVLLILAFQNWNVVNAQSEAKEELPYKELVIQIMPEYVTPAGWESDVPVLLIGQHGTFINYNSDSYEGPFTVSIPADQPDLYVSLAGKFDNNGELEELDYSVDEEAGILTWIPEEPVEPGEEYRYVVEYYYSLFNGGTAKEMEFTITSDRETELMNVLYFEPLGAEDTKLSHEPDRVTDMFGVPVHAYDFEQVSAGEVFDLSVTYVKDSIVTTLEALEDRSPPDDDIHAGFMDGGGTSNGEGGNNPIISTENSVMISISIIIAGIFVFFGLRGSQNKKSSETENTAEDIKRGPSDYIDKKTLRKQFLNGEIDEKTYRLKLSKLS